MKKLKHRSDFTFEFNYKGEDISVHGTFIPATDDTRDTPGTSERFVIDKVTYLNSDEVPELFTEALEEHILNTQFP